MRVCPNCYGLYGPDQTICPKDGAQTAHHSQILIGKQLGGYVVRSLISEGGMGVVYVGEHPTLGRRVALKVLRPELSLRDDIVERFTLEARAVNTIGHSNIVNIYDFGTTPYGSFYIVMEYLDGQTVRRLVDELGPQPIERVWFIIKAVGEALAAAHAKGFIHRDVKPENIMICNRSGKEYVKLLDFGIAKLLGTGTAVNSETGAALGTPQYMSPEQLEDLTVDHRSDIYALGVVTHEMLTGTTLYPSKNHAGVRQMQLTQGPRPLSESLGSSNIASSLDAAVLKATSLDPQTRFDRVEDFLDAFHHGYEDTCSKRHPRTNAIGSLRKRLSVIVPIVILALAIGVITALFIKPKTLPNDQKSSTVRTFTNISLPQNTTQKDLSLSPQSIHEMAQTIVQEAIKSPQSSRRELVIKYVGILKKPIIQTNLYNALNDPRPEIRKEAAQALGNIKEKSPQTLAALKKALSANQKFVAIPMAVALAKLQNKEGQQYLKREFSNSNVSPVYRKKLLEALGEVGLANQKELKRAYEKASNIKKKISYLGFLAVLYKDKAAILKLKNLLKDPATCIYAAKELAKIPSYAQSAKVILKNMLTSHWANLKVEAAQELSCIGDPQGVPVLIESVSSPRLGEEFVSAMSALALGQLGQKIVKQKETNKVLVNALLQATFADLKLAAAVVLFDDH